MTPQRQEARPADGDVDPCGIEFAVLATTGTTTGITTRTITTTTTFSTTTDTAHAPLPATGHLAEEKNAMRASREGRPAPPSARPSPAPAGCPRRPR